jgi:drug/metabolite transporter (DMT)-like permease
MRGRALLYYSICCLTWGSTWLVIKIGLADLPAFYFAGLRMAIACLALTPLVFRKGRPRLTRTQRRDVAVSGLLQIGFSYAFVFAAEQRISSGLTAVIFACFPIWVGLFAHWMLPAEPLTAGRLVAALLGLGGVALLEAPALRAFDLDRATALAALLPLFSAVTAAFANVWMKKRLSSVSPPVNLWGQTLVGAAFLLLLSAASEGGEVAHWTPRAVIALLYLSLLGTVIAFLALFWLIPRVPMSSIGAIPLIDTLIAVALGALVLAEPVGLRLFAGGGLILAGAALANRAERESVPAVS